jgi:hypothetical protein
LDRIEFLNKKGLPEDFCVRAYVMLHYVNLKMILKTDSSVLIKNVIAQVAKFWLLISEIRFLHALFMLDEVVLKQVLLRASSAFPC